MTYLSKLHDTPSEIHTVTLNENLYLPLEKMNPYTSLFIS